MKLLKSSCLSGAMVNCIAQCNHNAYNEYGTSIMVDCLVDHRPLPGAAARKMSVMQMTVRRFGCLPTADVLTSTFGLLSFAQALMAACICQCRKCHRGLRCNDRHSLRVGRGYLQMLQVLGALGSATCCQAIMRMGVAEDSVWIC